MNAAEKGSRRRAAERTRPTVDRALLAPAVVVLLALAAVLLTTSADPVTRADTAGLSRGALVDSTTFACPDLDAGRRVTSAAALGLAPAPADLDVPAGGEVTQGPVASRRSPGRRTAGGGGRRTHHRRARPSTPPAAPPRACSASAPTSRTGAPSASRPAPRPGRSGGSPAPAPASTTPPPWCWPTSTPDPRSLDLTVLGPDGEVETVGTQGVTLPPHSVRRVALAEIAPQTDDLAIGVRTSRGRVVAAVDDAFSAKASGRPGQDWLAGTDLPSRTLRLAGVPATSGSSPPAGGEPLRPRGGRRGARRRPVRRLRARAGWSRSPSPPGTIEQLDLSDVLPKKEAVALRLRSRVPGRRVRAGHRRRRPLLRDPGGAADRSRRRAGAPRLRRDGAADRRRRSPRRPRSPPTPRTARGSAARSWTSTPPRRPPGRREGRGVRRGQPGDGAGERDGARRRRRTPAGASPPCR